MNGTLIDTALDMRSRPIAIPNGFFSGRASATIFRNDDALFVESCAFEGRNRLHRDFFVVDGADLDLFEVGDVEEDDEGVEIVVESEGGDRVGVDEEKCLRPRVNDSSRILGAG